jgi:preprotein translocase subunit YajC
VPSGTVSWSFVCGREWQRPEVTTRKTAQKRPREGRETEGVGLVSLAGVVWTGSSLLAADSKSGSGPWGTLVLFALIGLGMYLVFLRPQRSRMKRAQQLQQALVPGQLVMTGGGLFGTVAAVEDDAVLIEIAPGVTTRWARGAIGRVVTPEESLGLGEHSSDIDLTREAERDPGGDDPIR